MKSFLTAALSATALVTSAGLALAEGPLTVTSYGGAYAKSQETAFYKPFTAATGVEILQDEWDGSTARLKGMVETGQITWDVVDVEPGHALQGCDEGWLEEIDYDKIGGREGYVPGAAMDCAVATIVFGTIFAYDVDKFPQGGPQTMVDFFDTAKFPGPRAMRKAPKTTLEMALIGDGVPAAEVYEVLSTPEGVDRAFAKLDTIKGDVKVWWSAGAQPPQLLADGEVAMSTAWNGRIYDAIHNSGKNFKIVWDGQGMDFNLWAKPVGGKNSELADRFIASTLQPAPMVVQAGELPHGPTLLSAIAEVPAEILAELPTAPQNMENAFVVDAEFWANHDEELTERFNKWLAQ
ncbi:ABC transporter substrate-binding protein [Pseudogemmobacter faecipullorum]|uniref:ABC transporter substrate-binding protein n=1 Tax=Pseudogemmobacter faecipullorum TaxID=2755041 RepID=A0ABS8CM54_9RHOB|nr:ABC transporter substrate-binding protein [Pseudogemmobacter faecipullorum]MCB5410411.1 ABC transporter substrate-binding protein [Pseudogemmobacter faecipullorum]